MRYRAFISYSHADEAWARWLMRRLETYRVPSRLIGLETAHGTIAARLGTFFRDRDELTADGDLSAAIRTALADSEALIVICSPAAAASTWVGAEIDAFRADDRGERVLAFVVAGEPNDASGPGACFPSSLLAPRADGRPVEPLAADARREGDGRERAFLKLVAGLLGVSFDALAQREAQRRQRRLAVVAALSLCGMAIAIGLAATAWIARNDAQRRQAQAEDILGFMLGDLRKKLTTVGRLDLMRTVDDKATHYFATLDPRDMSDRALEEQARSLSGIGQVRLDEGHHDEAMQAFREALARSTALYERAPANGQRLFDLAQAEYWIGFATWQQGRLKDAGVWLRKYRDSAIRLAAMDRNNFDWQREVAYGHHNLAVLDDSLGRYAQAEQAMREELSLYRTWTRARPNDTAIRFEAANVASWLGSLMMRQGRLREAERFFTEERDAYSANLRAEPDNADWKSGVVTSSTLLAEAQAVQGKLPDATARIDEACDIASGLARHDPQNNTWRADLGVCRLWQARFDAIGRPNEAAGHAASAAALLSRAYAAEPNNERILTSLVGTHLLLARLSMSRGELAEAGRQVASATAQIEPAWHAERNERLRLWLARTRLAQADLAQATGNGVSSQALRRVARQLLTADGEPLPFSRLDPLVRTLAALGDGDDERPYVQRLAAAGYVPIERWPAHGATTARSTQLR